MVDDGAAAVDQRVYTGQAGLRTKVGQIFLSLPGWQSRGIDAYPNASEPGVGAATHNQMRLDAFAYGGK